MALETVTLIRQAATSGLALMDNESAKLNSFIDLFLFDADLSIDFAHSATVTAHPVESGSTIADHVAVQPLTIRAQSVVSLTPLSLSASSPLPETPNRDVEAWWLLEALFEQREAFTLSTQKGVYTDMVMTSLSDSQDGSTGQRIAPSMEFQQITIVETSTTTLPPRPKKSAVKPRAADPADKGEKTTDPTPPAEPDTDAGPTAEDDSLWGTIKHYATSIQR